MDIFALFFVFFVLVHEENFLESISDPLAIPNPIHLEDIYLPTKCESCIVFAREFESLTTRLPRQARDDAEGWLIDQLENICRRMLEYRIHRERTGVDRFAKEPPKIVKLAHDLESKGVELKLDVPTVLLNEPTVESDMLRRHCETFVEVFETDIEEWFFKYRKLSFEKYLCAGSFAKRVDPKCSKNESIINRNQVRKSVKNEL